MEAQQCAELTGTNWPCGLTTIFSPAALFDSWFPYAVVSIFGGNGGGVTPVPIPNTEVKPSSADGTAGSLSGRVGRRRIYTREPRSETIWALLFLNDLGF